MSKTATKKFRNPSLNYNNFINEGYRFWTGKGMSNYADGFWQKKFTDNKGIKYFIEFYEYDWSKVAQIGRAHV